MTAPEMFGTAVLVVVMVGAGLELVRQSIRDVFRDARSWRDREGENR